jgi:hypothetical protein
MHGLALEFSKPRGICISEGVWAANAHRSNSDAGVKKMFDNNPLLL